MPDLAGVRIAITGGAGFVGSHLVELLAAQRSQVLIIDDLSSCGTRNIEHLLGRDEIVLEQADVRDATAMMTLLKGCNFVFHLATRNVRLSLKRPTEIHEINTSGTLNVLKAASAAKAKRFLYCSSSEVNGTAGVVPMAEDYAYNPETIYGASKLTGEYYTQVFQKSGWLDTVIARPHNTYGPREHFHGHFGEVIPRFILFALAGKPPIIFGDGVQTRDFTFVTETADFLARLGLHPALGGETFNICRGAEVSILEIAAVICRLTGLQTEPIFLPARPNDVRRLWGDPSRLIAALGEGPKIDIEQGLSETVDWFRREVRIDESVIASLDPRNWAEVKPEPWLE